MKRKGIVLSLVGIILISSLLILLVNKNTKQYIMQDGVMLALTLDGKSITSFPSGANYHVDIDCTGGIGKYQPVRTLDSNGLETDTYEMKFTVEDITTSSVKCNLDFYTITNDNKNNYLATTEIESKATISTNQNGICSDESYTTPSACTSAKEYWYYVSSVTSTNNNGNTDISYRYAGKQPNNYVWFNNELWRIIGSIPTCIDSSCTTQTNLVKIMRAESIGGLAYHSSNTNTTWGSGNTLYTLLNSYYYGKQDATYSSTLTSTPCFGYQSSAYALCNYTNKGISNDSNDYYGRMIESVYMNAGTVSSTSTKIDAAYTLETATLTSSATPVGLMTSSDYGFATSGITYSSVGLSSLSNYEQNNWIYGQYYEWTMTPSSTSGVLSVSISGNFYNGSAYSGLAVRPVVYLDSSVYVISGTGEENNPYILGM